MQAVVGNRADQAVLNGYRGFRRGNAWEGFMIQKYAADLLKLGHVLFHPLFLVIHPFVM